MRINDNIYDRALHHIGRNEKGVFVVIIGAMDGVSFDETRGYISMYNWSGLFVEPMPDQFARLQALYSYNSGCICENSAISDYNGTIKMIRIAPDIINQGLVHPCFGGMSAIYPPKNGLGSEGDKATVEKYGEFIDVTCITPCALFDKHNIQNFDIVSIDTEGHDYTVLKNIDLKKYKPKVVRIEHINLTPEEQQQSIDYLVNCGYVYNVIGQNLDAVRKDYWEKITNTTQHIPAAPQQMMAMTDKKNITLVTGIWDLGRDNAGEGFKRPFTHYIVKFTELLKATSEYNMVIYIEEKYRELISSIRSPVNTQIRIREVDDFKTLFPFYNKVTEIRKNENWLNQAAWLRESTQATMDLYNPMVMSKMFMLNDEKIRNPFDSEYLYWIDGGLTSTVHSGYFSKDKILDKIPKITDKFLFVAFPYADGNEIHGFTRTKMNEMAQAKNVEYVCRGGFFGGHKNTISDINGIYYSLLSNTLNEGYMGTEESIFTLMTYAHPHLFAKHMIEGNGLINKFFEDIKTTTFTENTITLNNYSGVNLYVLSFNSPEQFEKLIESYLKQPGFIRETKNILIDNSTNPAVNDKYVELCAKFNFEHIKKDNIGICGGRQFVAEHFDSTDAKYYMFLEDDMNLCNEDVKTCKNGFSRCIENLYYKIQKIMDKEDYDFLKLSFTEFFGDNTTQWSWYNVPQSIRELYWPDKQVLPVHGLDPNSPKTIFKHIGNMDGVSYIDGEVYYCNWPQIVSRTGNKRMFLSTKWGHPFEQTWMSFMYQLTKKNMLRGAVLLASPINHERFAFYKSEERREN